MGLLEKRPKKEKERVRSKQKKRSSGRRKIAKIRASKSTRQREENDSK